MSRKRGGLDVPLFITVWENLMLYSVEFRLLDEEESISTDAHSRLGKFLVGARTTRVRLSEL